MTGAHHHQVCDDHIALTFKVRQLELVEYMLGLVEIPSWTESNGGHIELEDSEST